MEILLIVRQPKVSILMNCYNGEKYLEQAIQSVRAQSYSNWEIEFWDNCSHDQSREIANSFNDKRIHYHCAPKHTTLGAARMAAQQYLRGEWIAVLDADDLWYPDKLEKQIILSQQAEHVASNPGLIYSLADILTKNDGSWQKTELYKHTPLPPPEGYIFNELVRYNFVPLVTVLMNRNAFFSSGGYLGKYTIVEDYSINLRIARAYRFAAISKPLAAYRVHNQAMSQLIKPWISDIEDIKVKLEHWKRPDAVWGAFISATRTINNFVSGWRKN